MVGIVKVDLVFLVAIGLEFFLYGVYCIMFAVTLWLMQSRKHVSISRWIWVLMTLHFVLSTMHMAVSFRRLIEGFTIYRDSTSATVYFNDLSNRLAIFSLCIYGISTLVGDCLVVWRCWVLWGRKWWILAFFTVLLAGLEVCGVRVMILTAKLKAVELIYAERIPQWFTAFIAVSLATNLIVSAAIAYRLYSADKKLSQAFSQQHELRYRKLMWAVLESGSLYPVVMILYIALYSAGLVSHWIVNVNMVQINAIVPCLMIIAVVSVSNQAEQSNATELSVLRHRGLDHTRCADRLESTRLSQSPPKPHGQYLLDISRSTVLDSASVVEGKDRSGDETY